ncbi:MAG: glycosyltransferase [Methylococcaceae bacterium]
MHILYIGDNKSNSTSRHRADALSRLGHKVLVVDPYADLSRQLSHRFLGALHYRSGYRLLQYGMINWVNTLLQVHAANPTDLVWVNGGELLGHAVITKLRQFNCPLILYMNDDPTGSRDGRRFDSLLKALSSYDLCAVVRNQNVTEFLQLGAPKAFRVWMSYDEIIHQLLQDSILIPLHFQSEVAFVGTWMRNENRDQFMLHLLERGLNIAIWGDRWQKSAYWPQLKNHWRGSSLSGQDYVSAIQGAKICLGLLSKGNRDLHTTRSMEIPYAGGLLCAERTTEHLELYCENEEAVFWSDAQECAEKCLDLLAHPEKRERIRLAGMKRVLENKVGNEDICQQIITAAFQ